MERDAQLAKALDECLDSINEGKPIDVCVAASPRLHDKVAPLLYTGHYISTVPKVEASEEFRRTAKGRLIARLQEEERLTAITKTQTKPASSFLKELNLVMNRVWQSVMGVKRIALPVAIGLVLIIVSAFSINNFMSPSPALADGCTLSIISGNVEISGQASNQAGTDGMTLNAGTRIKTMPDSSALLTFFDGSTVELKSDTEIEITRLESNNGKAVTIVLKQWVGRTWSTVVKMADKGSRYQIETPSAVALVRGTQFLIDVDNTGRTREHTTQGLVSVSAKGEEVLVPPGQVTIVETGTPPSEPVNEPEPEDVPGKQPNQQPDNKGGASEWAQSKGDNQSNGNSNDNDNSNPDSNTNANGSDNGNVDANGNDNGNSGNNDNASSSGDNNGNGNGNANGIANGNDNSNAGGNGNANGSDNDNSGGSGNANNYNYGGSGNSGNGNANGNDNGNPGGNDNSNSGGNDNSNSGGNDNSNSGGNDNSNSGGNDNSNSGGNDNSNSGGNDNSNSGGDDNGNSGGNDNGNSGGDDNSNSGGNDNGNSDGNDNGNSGGDDNGNSGNNDNANSGGDNNGNGNDNGNGKDGDDT
jgi:hypothetical protein